MASKVGYLQRYLFIIQQVRRKRYISKADNGYYLSDDEGQSNIEMMLEPLNLLGTLYLDQKLPDFVLPEKRKSRGMENLPPLIHAIKNSLVTEFLYVKYDQSSQRKRKVEPYALKEFKGRWYLLAVEVDGRMEVKTWGLDRIHDLYITGNRFCKNPTYKIEEKFTNVFGIFSDEEKDVEDVILSFIYAAGWKI